MEQKSGTVRAPLFSEQVALQAQLNEAWAKELKQQLEFAGNFPDQAAPKRVGASMRPMATGMVVVGLVTAEVAAYLLPDQPLVVTCGATLAALGAFLMHSAARADRAESALLIRFLANAIGRRRKEGTNPGMQNPFHNK